jgi:glycosyltransferase involved in cell wall biosynthesis
MKILHINTLFPPTVVGGAERTVRTLATSLAEHGHQITVVSLVPRDKALVEQGENPNIRQAHLRNLYWPFFNAGVRRPLARFVWHLVDAWNPFMRSLVRNEIRRCKPDVVITHNLQGWSSSTWGVVKDAGLPLVHVLHDQSLLCPQTAMFRNGKACVGQCGSCRFLSAPRKRLSPKVDAVVAVSAALLGRHQAYGLFNNGVKTSVIHNAWRGEWPDPVPALPSAGGGDASSRVRTIGYMGRIEGEKGVETLLKAWETVRKAAPDYDVRLRVAGTGQAHYVDTLKARYGIGDVELVGQMAPPDFFQLVDIIVVPSQAFEGLGNVAFEAMVFGRPVLVSNQGGLPEIPPDGHGLVFPAGDHAELSKRLQEILLNPERLDAIRSAVIQRSEAYRPRMQMEKYDAIVREAFAASA